MAGRFFAIALLSAALYGQSLKPVIDNDVEAFRTDLVP